jgi:sodium-dependent dicarboxylate transporter 2/3/5
VPAPASRGERAGRVLRLVAGPAAASIALLPWPELAPAARWTLAIAAWMAAWWVLEAVPISATALLPLAAFPLTGVLTAGTVSEAYGNEVIFLFLGGMLLAQSMERSGLHRRIALTVIRATGSSGRALVLGFLFATALVSMWVSNTATTVMVLPVALATLGTVLGPSSREASNPGPHPHRAAFAAALMLAIAYGANIGGMGTLVGTAPNVVFAGMVSRLFPEAPPVDFFRWLQFGVPLVVLFVPLAGLLLTRVVLRWDEGALGLDASSVTREIESLGPMHPSERRTMIVFLTAAFLWIFRADLELGAVTLPGWSRLLGEPEWVRDSTVAIAAALALFLIPAGREREGALLASDWHRAVPWSVLILLGGGFALAAAFQESGLSAWFGNRLAGGVGLPPVALVLLVALSVSFLTEVASNTAVATVLLPVLAAAAVPLGCHPFALMLPCALAASCAFMLPAATPPNAIVFSSGLLRLPQMVRAGLAVNFLGVALIVLLTFTIGGWALGADLWTTPEWALPGSAP